MFFFFFLEEDKEPEVHPPKKKSKKDKANPKWKKFLLVRNNENIRLTKKIIFALLIDFMNSFLKFKMGQNGVFDDIIELLVQNTNLYASEDKMNTKFKVSKDEIKTFIGLLLLSGYSYCSNVNDYWSTAPDLSAPLFAEKMCRQRFRDIKHYLHVCDNMNLGTEKITKVMLIYDVLNSKMQSFAILPSQQFICGKPIRFGYKCWMKSGIGLC